MYHLASRCGGGPVYVFAESGLLPLARRGDRIIIAAAVLADTLDRAGADCRICRRVRMESFYANQGVEGWRGFMVTSAYL